MRIEIYVRPGASRRKVGGRYDGALLVRVTERAEHGRATASALEAVADALDVPRRCVTLVHGASSRRKLVGIVDDDCDVEKLLDAVRLLAGDEDR